MAESSGEVHGGRCKMENSSDKMESKEKEGQIFEVDKIIGKSKIKGFVVYKVRWKGYGPADDTWEPVENFDACQDLIEEFNDKQKEIAKKRAEQRKQKLLAMEGRIMSSDASSDADSPYPSTFKNTFWKELEAGRVNVFDNDMYSKVKKRSIHTQFQSSSKDLTNSSSDEGSPKVVAKVRRHSDPIKSCAEKRPSIESAQKTGRSTKKKKSKSNRRRTAAHVHGMDFNLKLDAVDRKNSKHVRIYTDSDSTGTETAKPTLKLVIKKVPDISTETGFNGTISGEGVATSYTVLSKTSQLHRIDKDLKQNTPVTENETEHFRHKSKGPSSPSSKYELLDKKRKVSSTSLNNVPFEGSKGSDVKVPKMSEHNSVVLGEHKENMDNIPCVDKPVGLLRKIDTCSPLPVEKLFTFDYENKVIDSDNLLKTKTEQMEQNADISTNCPPSCDLLHSTGSHQLDLSISDGSHRLNICAENCSNGSIVDTNSMLGDPHLSRQVSEQTLDSGIHSPVSDENDLGLIQDGIDTRLLSSISNQDKTLEKVMSQDDYLEIDLPIIDWDLFDAEVSPEPITISNDEFAMAVMSGNFQCVRRALFGEGQYDMEQTDAAGKTLLMSAVCHGHDDITDLLVKNGADINRQMKNGYSPLMIACLYSEIGTVNLLLELGAKVNLQAVDGRTALFMAAERGHCQILWLLLECGSNYNHVCRAGLTAVNVLKRHSFSQAEVIMTSHIQKVTQEFQKQVNITLNGNAKVVGSVFQPQVFNVCDEETYEFAFHHGIPAADCGIGHLLFIGHAMFANQEVKCRLFGPCAVKSVTLNGAHLPCFTEEGNFVLAFCPLVEGRNLLRINILKANDVKPPLYEGKLIVCAFKAQLLQC